MKRIAVVLIAVIVVTLTISAPAFASGDKVRGDNAAGDANQVQIMNPPPFQ